MLKRLIVGHLACPGKDEVLRSHDDGSAGQG